MTREEAISRYIVPALKNTWNDKINNEVIEALEQEPCEDAISREMALKECHDIVIDGERYRVIQEETLLGLPPVNPQYTEDEIQKMQNLEQAEIEKAYELGKAEGQENEETETWNSPRGQITATKGTFERIFNDADDDSDI